MRLFRKKPKKSNYYKINCHNIEKNFETGDTICCKIIHNNKNDFLSKSLGMEVEAKPIEYANVSSRYFTRHKKYYIYYFEGFAKVRFDSSGHDMYTTNPNNKEVGIWLTDHNILSKRAKLLLTEKILEI